VKTTPTLSSPASADTFRENVTAQGILHALDLRTTASRVEVLTTILNSQTPLSLADVVQALEDKGFDRATLYRNLMYLVEMNVCLRHHFGDNVWRFSLNPHVLEDPSHACEAVHCEVGHPHSVHTHHPHFVCSLCHRVECYEVAVDLSTLLGDAKKGDLPFIEELVLRGTCHACR
jgi:Fur family ferric uptake transcriptional regulator